MVGKVEAFQEYALQRDEALICEFCKCVEDLADCVTKLISLMERYDCEDGKNVAPLPNPDGFVQTLDKIAEDLASLEAVAEGDHSAERLKKLGVLEARNQITKDLRDMGQQGGYFRLMRERINRDRILDIYGQISSGVLKLQSIAASGYPWTSIFLGELLMPFVNYLLNEEIFPPEVAGQPVTFASVTIWRQMRRILWDASDAARLDSGRGHRVARLRTERRVGRPYDRPTEELLWWAYSQDVTIAELARMLVDANLDRDQTGSTAARVRAERKRLAMFQGNQQRKRALHAASVGIKSS